LEHDFSQAGCATAYPTENVKNTESSNKQIPVVSPETRACFFPQESSSKRRKDELGVVGVSKFLLPSLL